MLGTTYVTWLPVYSHPEFTWQASPLLLNCEASNDRTRESGGNRFDSEELAFVSEEYRKVRLTRLIVELHRSRGHVRYFIIVRGQATPAPKT